jgi:rhamnogalacturonyl hydrolase YesR
MAARSPIEVARVLANEYGYGLEPVNYVRGVAMSGRLRLHRLEPGGDDPTSSIVGAVDPLVGDDAGTMLQKVDGSVLSGYVWADELSEATGDERYARLLEQIASGYLETRTDGLPAAVDLDYRVEDVFFAGALLGRAFKTSGDERYALALTGFLEQVGAQPDSGLWWHCNASPFTWGRGNAFAALGFAEALSYLPADGPRRAALEAKHRAHLETLIGHQDSSGAWRQVIDRADSYLELTVTAIIGYAIVRGMGRGWLSRDLEPIAARAWGAVAERVDAAGMVRDSCPGTGPLPTLEDYLQREPISGHDDRAGSMALWFAVEYAEYLSAGSA